MGLFELFWDYNQQQQIRGAQNAVQQAAVDVESTRRMVDELRVQIERMNLVNQAIWELVRDRASLTDADLNAKVQEIDLRDGQADGRITAAAGNCPKCGKLNARGRTKCMYCGTALAAPR